MLSTRLMVNCSTSAYKHMRTHPWEIQFIGILLSVFANGVHTTQFGPTGFNQRSMHRLTLAVCFYETDFRAAKRLATASRGKGPQWLSV